jgi:hypothetical protein
VLSRGSSAIVLSDQAIEYSFLICFYPPLLSAFLRTAFLKARTT